MPAPRNRRRAAALALLAAAAATAPAASAAEIDHGREYRACLETAKADPKAAQDHALRWHEQGGGLSARHCLAVALVGLGQPAEAAARLEALAREVAEAGVPPAIRSLLLTQAGQAWVQAGDAARAANAQIAALEATPDDPQLLIDLAISLVGLDKPWEAIDALNEAVTLAPDLAEARVLRGAAYRRVGAPEMAAEDIAAALRLAPDDPDALLERGLLRRQTGDAPGAREDWLKIIRTAPGSLAAQAAQRNLEALDVRTR